MILYYITYYIILYYIILHIISYYIILYDIFYFILYMILYFILYIIYCILYYVYIYIQYISPQISDLFPRTSSVPGAPCAPRPWATPRRAPCQGDAPTPEAVGFHGSGCMYIIYIYNI